MKCLLVREPGSPDAMQFADVPEPTPGPGQVLIRVAATGVNFIDIYFRQGLYKSERPIRLGSEAAGTIEAVGEGVVDLQVGDRVAYAMVRGSYAELVAVPSVFVARIPPEVDFVTAAGVMLQGMTAHYLTRSTVALKAGETCLVHAAAGGAGGMLVQMARLAGARVIGTVSTRAKAEVARRHGADDIIVYTEQDFEAEVRRMTNGIGVDVVYDSVGRTTFDRSLNCLRTRGTMVLFGQSSGPVPAFDPTVLNAKGSLYLTRPSLAHYLQTRDEVVWRAGEVFDAIRTKSVRLDLHAVMPLADAPQAHRLLESRKTTGKLVLTVA